MTPPLSGGQDPSLPSLDVLGHLVSHAVNIGFQSMPGHSNGSDMAHASSCVVMEALPSACPAWGLKDEHQERRSV